MTFLKGIHHTLDSWHGNRDADCWKMKYDTWSSHLAEVLTDHGLEESRDSLQSRSFSI